MHRALVVTGLVVALIACAPACSGSSGSSAGESASSPMPRGAARHDPVLLQGRRLFAANCARCHGDAGQGGVGPNLQHHKLQHDFAHIDAQIAFVRRGKGIMPAWGGLLSPGQLTAVVRYEREVISEM
jgi:cytochrome c oxidase subunit 2